MWRKGMRKKRWNRKIINKNVKNKKKKRRNR
jgi:hypothetical protein